MGVVRLLPVAPRSRGGPPAELSDADLVLLSRDGARDAKEALFRRHVRRAAGLGQRLLASDPSEVDDLVQDAFITAFSRLGDLKDPRVFGSWLGAIVVRTASKRLRRRRLKERLGLVRRQEVDLDDFSLPHHSTEALLDLRRIYSRLERFPTEERVALLLWRVEGMTVVEIAAHVGASVSTIKRRLRRAGERLDRMVAVAGTHGNGPARQTSGPEVLP